jgi:hypothetical protein
MSKTDYESDIEYLELTVEKDNPGAFIAHLNPMSVSYGMFLLLQLVFRALRRVKNG